MGVTHFVISRLSAYQKFQSLPGPLAQAVTFRAFGFSSPSFPNKKLLLLDDCLPGLQVPWIHDDNLPHAQA
jgi:hypothetical protein